jgi:hypothetical protein
MMIRMMARAAAIAIPTVMKYIFNGLRLSRLDTNTQTRATPEITKRIS